MLKIFNIIKNVKNKYLDMLIVILVFIFLFIIYKYKSNNIIKKNIYTSRSSITNNYLETKGDNVLLNNLNLLEIKENNILNNRQNVSSYIIKNKSNEIYDFSNPLVKKISSIIIGRYNLGEIKNKIVIKTVYYNVNDIINKKLKLRDDVLNDTYKFNKNINWTIYNKKNR